MYAQSSFLYEVPPMSSTMSSPPIDTDPMTTPTPGHAPFDTDPMTTPMTLPLEVASYIRQKQAYVNALRSDVIEVTQRLGITHEQLAIALGGSPKTLSAAGSYRVATLPRTLRDALRKAADCPADDDALRARIPPRGPRGRPKSTEVAVCTRRDVEAFMRRWNLDVGDMADWLKASPGSVRHWCYDTRPVPNKHGEKIVNFTGDVVDFPVYQTKLLENKTTGREGSLRYFGMDWHTNKLRSILVDDIEADLRGLDALSLVHYKIALPICGMRGDKKLSVEGEQPVDAAEILTALRAYYEVAYSILTNSSKISSDYQQRRELAERRREFESYLGPFKRALGWTDDYYINMDQDPTPLSSPSTFIAGEGDNPFIPGEDDNPFAPGSDDISMEDQDLTSSSSDDDE